jgi:hypothetical protein
VKGLELASAVDALPEDCAMRDGRKWKSMTLGERIGLGLTSAFSQRQASIDFNSTQRLKLLGKDLGVERSLRTMT